MDIKVLLQPWWNELNEPIFSRFILISSIALFSFLYYVKLKRRSLLNSPPSPWKLPIIGNLHQLNKLLHRSLQSLSEKYGPVIRLHLGSSPYLIVSSAEIARDIMKTHDCFVNRPQTKAANALFYGCMDIAFSPVGDYWKQAKRICVSELLSLKRVQAFQLVREQVVLKEMDGIHDGVAIDLCEMFETISNNIISRSARGRVYGREGSNKSFGELSKRAMNIMGAFCFKDMFPYLGWLDVLTGLTANLKSICNELNSFLDQVIEEHQDLEGGDHRKSDNKDVVDILLELQKDGNLDPYLSQESLKAILLDMFIGGTDTTAVTMEWAMAELIKNPRKLERAQEEVRRVVGRKSKVDESDINQMNYLKCVVKETLRLHSPVMVTRHTFSSTKLEGYDVPPNTTVLINAWAIQRDPNVWDMPEEFIPERFANSLIDFKGAHNQFISFGAGRRICPGISFAIAEVEFVLANLLYWFDWELPGDASVEELDMSDKYELVIRKKEPLCLVPKKHSF